jgi:hypothetical protein
MSKRFAKIIRQLFTWEQEIFRVAFTRIRKDIVRLHLFIAIALAIVVSSFLPYFNLILDGTTRIFAITIAAVLLFYPTVAMVMLVTLGMFFVAMIFAVVHFDGQIERIGNLIYISLWLVSFMALKELWQKDK